MPGLPDILQLQQVGEHSYEGRPEHDGGAARNVVFGGQILAQAIVAAWADRNADRVDGKHVKSIHAVFARAGDYGLPIAYEVERMHDGRTVGSDTVTFGQGGRIMARMLILWSLDEPDLIRHTEGVFMPDVGSPDRPGYRVDGRVFPGAEGRIVGGINTWDDDEPLRPAVQSVWTRYGQSYAHPVDQAILSWATDGFLIGTAMLPHAGYHEGQAHRTISTGVISHSISFHDPFRADQWLLLAHESVWAGRGRTHGRATVWTEDGRLVASYTQDNLVRAWADARDHTADYKRIM
jgi:acyl-CoA thioesterase-2